MGAMGGRGGLRQVWADLLDCCTPMQAGDLTDFEPLPNRQNAFSYEKERPAQVGEIHSPTHPPPGVVPGC